MAAGYPKPTWDAREKDLFNWSEGRFNPEETAKLRRQELPSPASHEDLLQGRVSVVCPTTDSRREFHGQLWSVFDEQSWPDKELVVLETYVEQPSQFLTEKAKSDDRLVYLSFKIDKDMDWSIGLKRNMCTHLASGYFLANFDDDDLYAASYLETMVREMVKQKCVAITLTTYYIFDANCGRFGWVDQRYASDSQRYGFGFSYVFTRPDSLMHPFPNQNMGEDYAFFNTLRHRKHANCFGSFRHVALHADECGICCHTLHPRSTSGVYAKHSVPEDEIEGLDIASLGTLGEYLGRFEKTEVFSGYLGRKSGRREQKIKVHTSCGDFDVSSSVGAPARKLSDALHAQLLCGGQGSDLRFHREKLPPQEGPSASSSLRKLRVLAVHGAASNSNTMAFQVTSLRRILGKDVEWIFPKGPVPWSSRDDVADYPYMMQYFAEKSSFEERIADGQDFVSWYELDPLRGFLPTEASVEAAVEQLVDILKREEPIDVVMAFGQGASLMNVVSARFRRASGSVPWVANVHFCCTPVTDEEEQWQEEPLLTPTFCVECPAVSTVSRDSGKLLYSRLYASAEMLTHDDGFVIPSRTPRALEICNLLTERLWKLCAPSLTESKPPWTGPPMLRHDERIRVRDTELWASLPRERGEVPKTTVKVSDMRCAEIAVTVKVYAIDQLQGVRQAVIDQHGSSSAAGQKCAKRLKLAQRVGKGTGSEEAFFFKGCNPKEWLLNQREFFAMGLQELRDQAARDRGLSIRIRVHVQRVQDFLLVDVPAPGTLRALRELFLRELPREAQAFAGEADPPQGQPLSDDAHLPPVVLLQTFRSSRLVESGCFRSIFFDRAQALSAQMEIIDTVMRPSSQSLLDQWEAESEGDDKKFLDRMSARFHKDILATVLEGCGLPGNQAGGFILNKSITFHFLEKDTEMTGYWLEIERLTRNKFGIALAERKYAECCA